jgi:uncharacterized protein YutE (UPF0331/DUF86 family)
MTPETTKRKINYLKDRLEELQSLLIQKKARVKITNLHVRTLERLFQLCVETAGNINQHFLSSMDIQSETMGETFLKLGDLKVLPQTLAKRLFKTVGLRNKLVHDYEKIDEKLLWSYLAKFISDYSTYIKYFEKKNK